MKSLVQTLLLSVALVALTGCSLVPRGVSGLADAPTQHVLVSTPSQSASDGVRVSVNIFPPQGGRRATSIEDEGGLLLLQRARPSTTPGIGANNDAYVVAYWCARPGFNTLCIAVSEDGELWDLPASLLIAASSQISNESGPSVTYFPPRNSWFVSFRDAATANIQLLELDIRCIVVSNRCGTDQRGAVEYTATVVGGPTLLTTVAAGSSAAPVAPTTAFRPTISHVGGNLIIAYNAAGTTPMTATVATSATGAMPFTHRVTGLMSDGGAPYVNKSVADLLVAVGRITPSGSVDLDVFASSDGTSFTLARTVPSVGSYLPGLINPAVSGPAAENLVAFRRSGASGTTVDISGNSINLSTGTDRPVSIAHGPGPHATASHSCAEPFMTVSGLPGRQLTLGANDSGSVSTSGDAELQCGSFQAPAGCPANTNRVRVFRSLPGVSVECWN